MAEAIKKEFGTDIELIRGGGGIFDVHVNGSRIWSKHEVGRFPEHKEILSKLKGLAPKPK